MYGFDLPTLAEREQYVNDYIAMGGTGMGGNNLLKVISLVCYLTQQYRLKKDPETQPIAIIEKACGIPHEGAYSERDMQGRIAILCNVFLTEDAKFSTFGLTTLPEMLETINKIVDNWLPF